ncbi:MAG: rod shape-determining protein MreD [Deltaproteobacteria bacterium]|nr:rod shape-determining protein MreD [Deltaproteobacteria bacterium]
MKRVLLFFLIGFFSLVIQGSFLTSLPPRVLRTDVIFLIAIYLGFFGPFNEGGWSVILLGLCADLLGSPFLGMITLVTLSLFLLIRLILPHIVVPESVGAVSLWLFFLAILKKGIFYLLFSGVAEGERVLPFLFWNGVPDALWNALVGSLIFITFKKVFVSMGDEKDLGRL